VAPAWLVTTRRSSPSAIPSGVWYLATVDVIQFPRDERIRLGYYRVFPGGRIVWGAQTTACFPRSLYAALGVEVKA
jgi:hypothetical protein